MNSRIALLSLSMALAVASLALFITAAGATASNVSGEASGIEADTVMQSHPDNRLLPDQRLNISQEEPMTLTEPISIFLPLLDNGYVKYLAERSALMALYNSMNGDDWINNTGWGTNSLHCDWYGVTCDEAAHVTILDLGGNKLSGSIPSEIGDLPMLTQLRITATEVDC